MLKKILKGLGVLLGIIAVYLIGVFVIPFIPVSAEKTNEPKDVDIYILTNGVHTDIVVPIKNDVYDWSTLLPFENTISKRTDFNYIFITGWYFPERYS